MAYWILLGYSFIQINQEGFLFIGLLVLIMAAVLAVALIMAATLIFFLATAFTATVAFTLIFTHDEFSLVLEIS